MNICCFKCAKLGNCSNQTCYNAYFNDYEYLKEVCQFTPNGDCAETITNNGPLVESIRNCFVPSDKWKEINNNA